MFRCAAVDLIAQFSTDRQPSDTGADKAHVQRGTAHERQGIAINALGRERGEHFTGFGSGQAETHCDIGDITHFYAFAAVIMKPAHVPVAQVVRAHDPPAAITPVEHGEVSLEAPARCQHRRQASPPRLWQAAGHELAEPGLGRGPRDLVPRKATDVDKPYALAYS